MSLVKVKGVVRNSFYQPENELTLEQVDFINNHSMMMDGFSEEKRTENG